MNEYARMLVLKRLFQAVECPVVFGKKVLPVRGLDTVEIHIDALFTALLE